MAKVRFLESAYLVSHGKMFNFNDEADLEEGFAKSLFDSGVVDILADEVEKPTIKKPARKTKAKEVGEV